MYDLIGDQLESVTGPDTSGNMTSAVSAYRISADFVLTAAHTTYKWDRDEINSGIHWAIGIIYFRSSLISRHLKRSSFVNWTVDTI